VRVGTPLESKKKAPCQNKVLFGFDITIDYLFAFAGFAALAAVLAAFAALFAAE
jgi:hypothetical protein